MRKSRQRITTNTRVMRLLLDREAKIEIKDSMDGRRCTKRPDERGRQ